MPQQVEFRGQTYQFPDGTTKEQVVGYFKRNTPIPTSSYPSEKEKENISDKDTGIGTDLKWSAPEKGREIDFSFRGVLEAIDRPTKALESAVSATFKGENPFKAGTKGLTEGEHLRLSDLQFEQDIEKYGIHSKIPAAKAAATETISRILLDPLNVVGGLAIKGAKGATKAASSGIDKFKEVTGYAKKVAPVGKEGDNIENSLSTISELKPRKRFVKTRENIDKIIKPMSARVREISPKIYGRWMKMEYDSQVKAGLYLEHVQDLGKQYKKLGSKEKTRVNQALANGTWDRIQDILTKRPKFAEELTKGRAVLDDMEANILKAGEDAPMIENYWPILVRDPKFLNSTIGPGEKLRDKIVKAAESKKKKGEVFTSRDLGKIVNQDLRGTFDSALPAQSFLKERKKPFYSTEELVALANPIDAMQSYIREMTHHLEKSRMFGTKGFKDVDDSIGRLATEELLSNPSFTLDNAKEVNRILKVRFGKGERTPGGFVGAMKNILYIDALGQPTSAVTQLGDLGISVYVNGVYDTLTSVFGKRYLDRQSVGITDIARDMADINKTGQILNTVLKATQFKRIDSFGKDVFLNASFRKISRQMKSQKGFDKFMKKYKGMIPDIELDRMARGFSNLKSGGTITPEMRFIAWEELAKVQPITMAEMPEIYAKHPNGRIFYSLMSFTMKQIELARDTSVRKMIRGSTFKEKAEGGKNLVKLGLAMGIANTGAEEIKNFMRGRPMDPNDEGWQRIMFNFLKNYGVSSWMARDIEKGKLAQALVPSISVLSRGAEDVWKSGQAVINGDFPAARVWKHLPGIGDLIYNRELGGTKKFMERIEKEKKANTPEAKEKRSRRKQEKKFNEKYGIK